MKKPLIAVGTGVVLGLGVGIAQAQDGEAAAKELGCTACHAEATKLVGPSYQDVAERYEGDEAKILETVQDNVENGGSGNWEEETGGTPMPPQPDAAGETEQLEAIASWISGMAE
ncbi:MAG: c-type cytochrome [Thiohalorhabdus sp.]|uniref:c-type cytochrome n=1 Tax=Thiohalorhabdus sp. TaxID=3094134 RepID=UPI003981513A